jgi:hypothetical protein
MMDDVKKVKRLKWLGRLFLAITVLNFGLWIWDKNSGLSPSHLNVGMGLVFLLIGAASMGRSRKLERKNAK